MNQTIKEKWITALTDGSYKQGRAALHTMSEKYCCLGVLCDLYIKETGNARWFDDGEKERDGDVRLFFRSITDYDRPLEASFLPDEVRKWAEIGQEPVKSAVSEQRMSPTGALMELNDGQSFAPRSSPFPFHVIADFIRTTL